MAKTNSEDKDLYIYSADVAHVPNSIEYDDETLYPSIDKNLILKPVAYCKTHKCYLSIKQMKIHECLKKGCTGLQKIDCTYWEERERIKKEKKERKIK